MDDSNQSEFTLSHRQSEAIWQELTSALSSVVVHVVPRTREKVVNLNRSSCRSRRFEFQAKEIAAPLE
jgi:hypothetical protein